MNDNSGGSMPSEGAWLLGGAAAVVLGAFLPWASVLAFTIAGTDADRGVVALIGGVIAGLIGYQSWKGKPFGIDRFSLNGMSVTSIVIGGLVGVLALWFYADLSSAAEAISEGPDLFGFAEAVKPRPGSGLGLTILGAIAIVVGGIKLRSGQSPQTQSSLPESTSQPDAS